MIADNPNAPNPPSSDEVSKFANDLYGTLSNQIHGSPWDIDAVQLSDQLTDLERCVLEGLCKELEIL